MFSRIVHHSIRVDPHLGTMIHVVEARQTRPNLPVQECPFCPGGLEAPTPYDVRWIPNRWPAMPGDRCEVILYTSDHEATLCSTGVSGVRRVIDLWADRTTALGARDDVEFVLVFENRGAAVGATIAHPHGQIYAYDHVPDRLMRLLVAGWRPEENPGGRLVAVQGDWIAVVPYAPIFPVSISLAPRTQIHDLIELDERGRNELAALLVDVLGRLDALYGEPLPYMMWLSQRPMGRGDWPTAWLNIDIVSPWRGPGTPRFIAAAEVAGGEYFNPVEPEDLAWQLRNATAAGPAPTL